MPDGTLQILGQGTSAVPLDVDITGSQLLDLISVKADFDGASAGVDFVPMVEIVSDAGVVMAQAKGPTVLAGDSATVTFFPFGAEDTPGSTGGITEVDSPDGSIGVSSPFGPVVSLHAFAFSVEIGAGGGTAGAGSAISCPFSSIGGSLLFDYSIPTAPKPKNKGWYQFTFTSGAGGGFGAGKQFESDVIATSAGLSPSPSASASTIGDGASPVEVSFSLPPVHMQTTDSFTVNLQNLDVVPQPVGSEFYVVLVRPG